MNPFAMILSNPAIVKGLASRGQERKVFDWDKAARLIKESGAKLAVAGLDGDWSSTAGAILEDGKPVPIEESWAYLESTWATPSLELGDGEERIDCWLMASDVPNYCYWPQSALDILNADVIYIEKETE